MPGCRQHIQIEFMYRIIRAHSACTEGLCHLNSDPQDYVVIPEQPWLDGYCVDQGIVRQFVAMPLGEGYTVEEQLTGSGQHGGLQIVAYPMKADRYKEGHFDLQTIEISEAMCQSPMDMGLAPGGRMEQEIYEDPYGLDAWDQRNPSRCFISIVNTQQWLAITNEMPPTPPPTAKHYTDHGLPWFEFYGGDAEALAGSATLKGLESVAERHRDGQRASLPDNDTLHIKRTVQVRAKTKRQVREPTVALSD